MHPNHRRWHVSYHGMIGGQSDVTASNGDQSTDCSEKYGTNTKIQYIWRAVIAWVIIIMHSTSSIFYRSFEFRESGFLEAYRMSWFCVHYSLECLCALLSFSVSSISLFVSIRWLWITSNLNKQTTNKVNYISHFTMPSNPHIHFNLVSSVIRFIYIKPGVQIRSCSFNTNQKSLFVSLANFVP